MVTQHDLIIVQYLVVARLIKDFMNVEMEIILMEMVAIVFVEQSLDGTVSMGMNSTMRLAMNYVVMAETLVSMNVMMGIE